MAPRRTLYEAVRYPGVSPGIDAVFRGKAGGLEYNFEVAPGADAGAIALRFDGAIGVALQDDNSLVVKTAAGEMVQHAPVAYQMIGGAQRSVTVRHVLDGAGLVRFELDESQINPSVPLVIDPILVSSRSFAGIGSNSRDGWQVALGPDGSTYVAGSIRSFTLGGDGVLARFTPAGSLGSLTYFGGAWDVAGLAVDGSGSVY